MRTTLWPRTDHPTDRTYFAIRRDVPADEHLEASVARARVEVFGNVAGGMSVAGGGAVLVVHGDIQETAHIEVAGGGAVLVVLGRISPTAYVHVSGGGSSTVEARLDPDRHQQPEAA